MKRLFILFSLAICITTTAMAQSYTQHLQEKKQGMGSVAVTQSDEIDKLVNTTNVSARPHEAADKPKPTTPQHSKDSTRTKDNSQQHQKESQHPKETPQHPKETPQHPKESQHQHAKESTPRHESTSGDNDEDLEIPTVDTRKKVMRRSYKVNGYRVQVFAGGNSRNDKIKAQQAGNSVKAAFPSQPVYVHFYSPRWICRMGNYRTYEEANAILTQVKKMGYKQACIVSGKITVAY